MKKQSSKKLVEILAVELKEWPEGINSITQSCVDSEIYSYENRRTAPLRPKFYAKEKSCEPGYPEVTREMWEAERAKLSKPKANKDGWIRHRGGKCPVSEDAVVEYRMRDKLVMCKTARHVVWGHYGETGDVMAYRVVEQDQSEDSVDAAPAEPEMPAAKYFDGPIQWRDRITEIDRTVEALEEERASLIQKLADEGFKLIKREAVELPDMSDWRNWREGDVVVCTEEYGDGFAKGNKYTISEIVSHDFNSIKVVADEAGRPNGWQPRFFKWHSRPTK